MQITVEVKFEQHRRVVGRTACVGTASLVKTQRVQIQRADEGVEETHGIFSGNVILQPFRKEQRLRAIQTRAMFHA